MPESFNDNFFIINVCPTDELVTYANVYKRSIFVEKCLYNKFMLEQAFKNKV